MNRVTPRSASKSGERSGSSELPRGRERERERWWRHLLASEREREGERERGGEGERERTGQGAYPDVCAERKLVERILVEVDRCMAKLVNRVVLIQMFETSTNDLKASWWTVDGCLAQLVNKGVLALMFEPSTCYMNAVGG